MSRPAPVPADTPAPDDKGLKANAIGLLSSVVIGVASTAPAYSLAASLGLVAKPAGVHAPGILLLAFLPMLCLAVAFHHLNREEPDCGTSFRWVARAFGPVVGPYAGWMAGWSAIVAGIMVMASLAQITGAYTFELVGLGRLARNRLAVAGVGVGFIALLTWLCVRGIDVAARLQWVLLAVEIVALLVFATAALHRVYAGAPPPGTLRPAAAWLNPLGAGSGPLATGFLAALFIYWGWDSPAGSPSAAGAATGARFSARSCSPRSAPSCSSGCWCDHSATSRGRAPPARSWGSACRSPRASGCSSWASRSWSPGGWRRPASSPAAGRPTRARREPTGAGVAAPAPLVAPRFRATPPPGPPRPPGPPVDRWSTRG
ncbi:MAG: amino acid permease [Deltaproteobacteria bacterium]|nr:amino acid permease [Deltaproteobacteria bacterium]